MSEKSANAFGFTGHERLEYERTLLRLRFASLLEAFMEESGIQARELAARMGKGKAWISKLLSGRHNPTVDTMAEAALALGLRWEVNLVAVDRAGTSAENDAEPPAWTRPQPKPAEGLQPYAYHFVLGALRTASHQVAGWTVASSGNYPFQNPKMQGSDLTVSFVGTGAGTVRPGPIGVVMVKR